jgi:hypothetical protein
VDNGLPQDKRILIGKLGLAPEDQADLDIVLAEFEAHPEKDGWLTHPRTRTMLEEQEQVASRGRAGASKRWNGESSEKATNALKPKLNQGAKTDDEDPF